MTFIVAEVSDVANGGEVPCYCVDADDAHAALTKIAEELGNGEYYVLAVKQESILHVDKVTTYRVSS